MLQHQQGLRMLNKYEYLPLLLLGLVPILFGMHTNTWSVWGRFDMLVSPVHKTVRGTSLHHHNFQLIALISFALSSHCSCPSRAILQLGWIQSFQLEVLQACGAESPAAWCKSSSEVEAA